MATTLIHRGIRIVSLEAGENLADHCRPNDIAIVSDEAGWWTRFVGEGGEVTGYDEPFPSHEKAVHAAKAAAEFAAE